MIDHHLLDVITIEDVAPMASNGDRSGAKTAMEQGAR